MAALMPFQMIKKILFLLALLAWQQAFTQEAPEKMVIVILYDGSEIVGRILVENDAQLVLESRSLGKLNIPRRAIRQIGYGMIKEGDIWKPNLDAYRNIAGPGTGYGLPAGEGYYQNHMLFFHQFHYGVTDWFSLGAGTEMISLFSGEGFLPAIALMPKFTLPLEKDKFNLGTGLILLNIPDSEAAVDIGILYLAATYGSPYRNFSFGLGYTIEDGRASTSPIFSLGGQYRLTRGLALTTENWIGGELQGSLFSVGIRAIGKRAVNWDIALVGFLEDGGFFTFSPVPLLGATVAF